jgi:four helix bundle protein
MDIKSNSSYFLELKTLMNQYVHLVYDVSAKFPKDEMFGLTSQLRRSSLSVVLNFIEGYARKRKAVFKNFLEISYGSLQESRYLIKFAGERKLIEIKESATIDSIADKIGAMLWGIMEKLKD